MRPEILNPLFADITTLTGVGPKLAKLIGAMAGEKVLDLLWHLPSGLIDRRYCPKIKDAAEGSIATITGRVIQHRKPPSRRQPYRVVLEDDTGQLTLVFFHGHAEYLMKVLPEGEDRVVSGKLERYGDALQMTHPDHIATPDDATHVMAVEPVYPLTAGVTQKVMGKAVRAALDHAPDDVPEWQDAAYLKQNGWPVWRDALLAAHAPDTLADLEPGTAPKSRLAYDELLANQLALALVRLNMRRVAGRSLNGDGSLRAKITASLPFTLTGAQQRSLSEIDDDLAAEHRMLRLLQGDVGSGKTVVALLAMATAVEAGGQAVLMAPTEILARQHVATLEPLCQAAGISLVLLTGRDKGKKRDAILAGLASGETALAVGTHALFQDDVAFHDLRLAVIDEQHRFGVHQRLTLTAKGRAVDVLVMTATPIPRTLMLTAYGDMDVSRLDEKPQGRQPIKTVNISAERLGEVVDAVGRALKSGAKVYWVCPLVGESEVLDLAAAEQRHAHLAQVFGDRVGLIHGKMKPKDKDAAMAAFADGPCDVLVATTVIEVGVDVPDATVMVIEHAERFGLAQLHQLRGRIGRGDKASSCLLLHANPMGAVAKERLTVMRDTDDGFVIAEKDLELRGAGELLGTRQSGLPAFRVADITAHAELLAAARDDAQLILDRDPELTGARGQALRVLLYLFERDAAVRLLRSG